MKLWKTIGLVFWLAIYAASPALAQNAQRFVLPYQYVNDATGVPIPGAKLFFYASGTTTPLATYANIGLTVPNANPVQANAAGIFPNIFMQPAFYKVVLTDSFGKQIWTADPVANPVPQSIPLPALQNQTGPFFLGNGNSGTVPVLAMPLGANVAAALGKDLNASGGGILSNLSAGGSGVELFTSGVASVGPVPNSSLVNSTMDINGTTCTLGPTLCTVTSSLTPGTSPIVGDNGGVLFGNGSGLLEQATTIPVRITLAGPVSQPLTGAFFENNGAVINRMNDRLFIDGATLYNPADCCVETGTWLASAALGGLGGTFADVYIANGADSNDRQPFFAAAQSATATSQPASTYPITFLVENNNATFGTYAWGIYGEGYQMNTTVGGLAVMELENRNVGGIKYAPDPFVNNGQFTLDAALGCGAGQTPTGNVCSTALLIFSNQDKFTNAITIAANTISADGPNGTINAIAMPVDYEDEWFSAHSVAQGSLLFTSTGFFILRNGIGNSIFAVNAAGSTVNAFTILPSTTGVAPTFEVSGADTNISMQLEGKGTGSVISASPFVVSQKTLSVEEDSIGATSTNGIILGNITAAAAGAQQFSPRLQFFGQGWKTTSTAASEGVQFIEELQPVQGASAPTGNMVWSSQINNTGGFVVDMTLTSGGVLNILTGFQVNGAATSGNVLRGNGTNFVSAQLSCSDLSTGCSSSGVGSLGNFSADSTLTITGTGAGPWTGAVTIKCAVATASQIGCSEPDNVTIKATAGVLATQNTTLGSTAMTPGSTYTTIAGLSSVTSTTFVGALTGHASADLQASNNLSDVVTKATAFNNLSPMTTAGDIIYGGTSGAGTRLAAGTSSQVLIGGTTPSWGSVTSAMLSITTTTCTNQFVTAISSGAVGTCTTDTLASAQHANQGTTTTVLHGNAAGNPSWASVSLSADVTGSLALTSLATQATNTVVGNATSGSASPTALSMTSCSTSASAVSWTTNTGFGCNTAINAATLGGATFASPGAIGGTTPGAGTFTTVTLGVGAVATPSVTVGATGYGLYQETSNLDVAAGGVRTAFFSTANAGVTVPFFLFGQSSDVGNTDSTLCLDSTNQVRIGSGTLGICLGTSSRRYKRDIHPLMSGLDSVMALQPETFFYKNEYGDHGARQQYGFIAEDVVNDLPGLVGLDDNGDPNSVDILGMVPVLVNALQEQQREINRLKGH